MAQLEASMIAILVVISLFISGPMAAQAAIGCGTVFSNLGSCIPVARSGAPPSPACCGGIRNLNNVAATSAARRAVCGCLKTLITTVPGLNQNYVAALPSKCGVYVPYPIRLSTDCNRVK